MSLFAMPSGPDLLIIAVIVLLLFGGSRLPSLMRSLGQSVTEFKKGLEGTPDDRVAKNEPPKRLDEQPTSEPAKN